MKTLNLYTMYHPGDMPKEKNTPDCPCGCAALNGTWVSPERLGITGTPAMLEIERLEKLKRAATPKPVKVSRPWKGASVDIGEYDVRESRPCTDRDCKCEHVKPLVTLTGDIKGHYHKVPRPVRIYKLGNAVAYVRTDSGLKL